MINTRESIFKTLIYRFKRLFKQADNDPKAFKKILYAVIMNDMIEWCDYKGIDATKLKHILRDYIQNNSEFIPVRQYFEQRHYRNVNLPQNNLTYMAYSELASKPIIPKSISYYEWDGSNYYAKPYSNPFIIEATMNPVKFMIDNKDLNIESAINMSFPADDCAEMFTKNEVTYNGSTYAEFIYTSTGIPLGEPIKITLI